ncbi:MAG: hypothetical protein JWM16_5657 [Verrucomicrobiales bacterium]|nr:hypothetical protein [Verrucomicrobiales bacterium]
MNTNSLQILGPSQGFLRFAKNAIERRVAFSLCAVQPPTFPGEHDPEKDEFMFRLHYVPTFAKAVIGSHTEKAAKPQIGLGELSTYLVAQHRTGLEFLLVRYIEQGKPIDKFLAEKPFAEWFDYSPECYGYWLKRFARWRRAAMVSWRYYLEQRCRKLKHEDPLVKESAFVGAAEKLGWLNEGLLDKFRQDCECLDPEKVQRVRNDVKLVPKTKKAVDPLQFNTWAHEIWPLVEEYGWNYHQVWKVASHVFEGKLASPSRVADRCKDLGLRLVPEGQAKRHNFTSRFPVGACMAMSLKSIAMNPAAWVFGGVLS